MQLRHWTIGLLTITFVTKNIVFGGTTGILEGKVIDKERKEPLAEVNVLVVGTLHAATTDTEGHFQINNIRAGVYDVRFRILGYKPIVMKNVTVLPDLRNHLDVELESSPIEMEAVEVQARQPLIQKDQAATAFSISEIKLEKLPVSTIKEVLSLQPSTTIEGNIRGGKTSEVVFLVDGLPVQDVIGGGLGASLPKSSITGLTIFTGGFDAEYGNALSGVINVVTKSGSSTHSLGIRLEKDNILRDDWDTEHNRTTEGELTATGPIIENRLTYFTSNNLVLTDTRWWQDFQYFFASPVTQELNGLEKVEYLFSPQTRLSVQGIYSLHKWHDYEFSWRFNLNGLPTRERDSYRLAAIFSQALSEHSYYTLSLSRFYLRSRIGEGSKNDLTLEPYEYDLFLRYIVGGKRNWWTDTRQIILTFKGEFTNEAIKSHLFKGGVELNRYDISSDLVKYEPQLTYFGKPIPNAPLLNYSNTYDYTPWSGNIFIQDKIQFAQDGSNASFGIRWDFFDPTAERPIVEFIPTRQNEFEQRVVGTTRAKFKHQLSPRIAVAGPVSQSSFLFVNFGHYFQFPLFDYLYSGINPVQLREGSKNILIGNPDLEPEKTIAWEIGFKHELSENAVFSVTYFQKSIENQIDAKTLVPFDSKFAGDYGFASYVNNAEAFARGLEFVISREHDDRLSGSISYTYMTTEGVSEYVDQRINFAQWGFALAPTTFPLSWDQQHTLKIDAESKLPAGIQTNLIILYNSPRPYTYFPTRDGFTPLDPGQVFIPNNARMNDVMFVNLKVSKQFALSLSNRSILTVYADARNVLNKANVKWIDSNGRIGGELSDPSAYYEPRRVRVGVKIEF